MDKYSGHRGATTGLTAQAVGAGNAVEQQSVLFRALIVALAAAFLLVLLQIPLAALGIAAMGISGDVASACLAYFFVRIWSAPFVLVNYAVLGWVIGRGEAGAGLMLQTLLNGVNIGLSLLFVLGWHWGVEGAAWASVSPRRSRRRLAGARRRRIAASRSRRECRFDLARLKRMLPSTRT
jgi:Na+-driven multidrug efflux pump